MIRYNLFSICWMIGILIFTLSPGGSHTEFIYGSSFDKYAHAILFCILNLLLTIGFSKQYSTLYFRYNAAWLAPIVANIYGVLVEFAQMMVPHRGFEPQDIVGNAIGTGIGFVLFIIIYRL